MREILSIVIATLFVTYVGYITFTLPLSAQETTNELFDDDLTYSDALSALNIQTVSDIPLGHRGLVELSALCRDNGSLYVYDTPLRLNANYNFSVIERVTDNTFAAKIEVRDRLAQPDTTIGWRSVVFPPCSAAGEQQYGAKYQIASLDGYNRYSDWLQHMIENYPSLLSEVNLIIPPDTQLTQPADPASTGNRISNINWFHELGPCFNFGALSTEAMRVKFVFSFDMDTSGRPVPNSIQLLSADNVSDAAVSQAFQAMWRAILRCGAAGFRSDGVMQVVLQFDPTEMTIEEVQR